MANTPCLLATDQVGRLRQQVGPSLSRLSINTLFLTMSSEKIKGRVCSVRNELRRQKGILLIVA